MSELNFDNIVDLLGEGNDFTLLRGQLRNIGRAINKDGKTYYVADLRCPRTNDLENVYGVSFNVFHVCFTSEFVIANNITDDCMKQYKDNEVVLCVSFNSNIRSYKNNNGDESKSNNCKIFVNDIRLVKEIKKIDYSSSSKKIVNI